jgi:hypothetical protein
MGEKVKIQTRINSFEEVQKSLQTIEQKLNELSGAVNLDTKGQVTDKEGKPGDIRVTKNPDKSHKLEVKTEEGWKYGSLGEKPVKYIDKPAEFSKPTAIKGGNLPLPDYDSGWFNIRRCGIYITGATDNTYPDDVPTSTAIYDVADNTQRLTYGIPALGFKLTEPPALIHTFIAPPGVSSWSEALSTGMVFQDIGSGQYYHNARNLAGFIYIMGENSLAYFAGEDHVIYKESTGTHTLDFGEGHSGGINDGNADWYQAFDSTQSAGTAAVLLRVWK